MGIRLALGANRPAILKLVLGQGMVLTAIGLAIGLAGATILMRDTVWLNLRRGHAGSADLRCGTRRCSALWRSSRVSSPRAAPHRSIRSRRFDRVRIGTLESGCAPASKVMPCCVPPFSFS
jgi:hypothetical protein